jgi:hypothetical protein
LTYPFEKNDAITLDDKKNWFSYGVNFPKNIQDDQRIIWKSLNNISNVNSKKRFAKLSYGGWTFLGEIWWFFMQGYWKVKKKCKILNDIFCLLGANNVEYSSR